MCIYITLPVAALGVLILFINYIVYIAVHPLTFLGADMKCWNLFHCGMWILGFGLIIIGLIK